MEAFATFPIFTISIPFDTFTFSIFVGLAVAILLDATADDHLIPNHYGIVSESLYCSALDMVHNYVGLKHGVYFPLVYTIFIIILISNLLGMLPYSYTTFSQLLMNLTIGFTLLIGIFFLGFIRHKWLLFGFFTPAGTPVALIPLMVFIEVISFLTRTLALGLRLAVNMITGHTLVKVVGGFIWLGYVNGLSLLVLSLPIFILSVFLALELLIAYLQAYIFTFIFCITLKELGQLCIYLYINI